MKKSTTLLLFLFLNSSFLLAQNEVPITPSSYPGETPAISSGPYKITWSQCFGGSANDIGFSLCEFDTSEVLVASYTYSDNGTITTPVHGDADWWAMKMTHSTTPRLIWSYTYGGTLYEKLRQMSPSYNKKSYALFGTTHSKDGDIDVSQIPKIDKDNWWLVKINDSGRILRQKLFVGAGNGECGGRSVLPTSDNGYILLGWSNAQDNDFAGDYSPGFDGWVFKVDSNLNIQWKNHYGGSGNDGPIRMIRAGGYYYFTGGTNSNNHDFTGENHKDSTGKTSEDFGVWKTDTLGNIIWAKCPGGSGEEFPFDIHEDWDGNILCAGYTTSNDGDVTGNHGGAKDGWLFKLQASDGSLMWEKCFGGPADDAIKRILPMPDHGFTLLCTSNSRNDDAAGAGNHGGKDVWLLRIDSNRNVKYGRMFGGSGVEDALDFQEFRGQGYLIMANTLSSDGDLQGVKIHTGQEVWMFFVTDSSLFLPALKFQPNGMSAALNPSSIIINPSLTSGFVSVRSAGPVKEDFIIRVMNIAGEVVWTKVVSDIINGPVNESIDLSGKPKGSYLVEIQFKDGKKQTQRVIVQ